MFCLFSGERSRSALQGNFRELSLGNGSHDVVQYIWRHQARSTSAEVDRVRRDIPRVAGDFLQKSLFVKRPASRLVNIRRKITKAALLVAERV